jgi:Ca-activated chloride channel homolog
MKNRLYISMICVMMFSVIYTQTAYSQGDRRLIREGNRLYQKEQFDESELSYRRALEKDEDSPQARFNLGNSLYKQQRFNEAIRFFGELAEETDDPLNRSKIFHNIGNSLLMSEQIEESIEAYKEALRNNPDDMETRYNLAYAMKLLDDSQDQQNDRQEGDDENDDQQQGDDRQQVDDNGESREEPDQPPQPRPDMISAEDAMRMLEAAEREEQKVQEKLMEKKASEKQPRTGKNW